jgi:hypothetical protein
MDHETDPEDEMSRAMLEVLTGQVAEVKEVLYPPILEQKQYIRKQSALLTRNELRELGNIIILNGLKSKFSTCKEGTLINLDTLENEVITQLYNFVSHKVNSKN